MATQLSAITLVGTTGQAYATGLRFVQFYFGLPLAMIILSLTRGAVLHTGARLHRLRVPRTAVRCPDADADALPVPARAHVLARRHPGRAGGRHLGASWAGRCRRPCSRWRCRWCSTRRSAACRRWRGPTSSRCSSSSPACARRSSCCCTGSASDVSIGQALDLAGATGRLQALDFRFDLRETYTFWSGLIGGLFLIAVVLRLRSEPGAALSDREVDRRGAPLAPDERLRQDSAAVAHPRRPACWCSCSTSSRRRRCCSTACTTRRSRRAAGRRVRRAPAATSRRHRRATQAAANWQSRRVSRRATAQVAAIRRRAATVVKETTGDSRVHRRQLRLSDLHHHAHADRPRRTDDRRDLRGGDVERRRASSARCRPRRSSISTSATSCRTPPMRTICGSRRSRRWAGGCLPASSPCRGESGVAHRGGESLRVVLLRLAARRLHPGDSHEDARRPSAPSGDSSPAWSSCSSWPSRRRSRSSGTT